MKSDHRHELKTNDLAEWISHLPQWFEQNRNTIIYVLLALILGGGFLFWYNYQKNVVAVRKKARFTQILTELQQRKLRTFYFYTQGGDYSFELLELAQNLSNLAGTTKDIRTAAFALIQRGQILRTELHYRRRSPDQSQMQEQIDQAKDAYSSALTKLTSQGEQKAGTLYPSLMAEAKLGLGLCEEELGNFEQAEQIYKELTEKSDFKSTTAAAQAKQRLDTMEGYKEQIVFKPAPQSLPAPVTISPEMIQVMNIGTETQDINFPIAIVDTNLPDQNQ